MAIELNPKNAGYHHNLALLLMQTGRAAEAGDELRKTIELDPSNSSRRINLSNFLGSRGDLQGAELVLREGLKQAPNDASLLNALAWSLAERGVKLDEALDLALQAVKAEPENGAYLDTLGWIHYKRGDYNEAEAQLAKAIERFGKSPGAADAWVHLGAVYERKNETDKAIAAYRRAISIQPTNKAAAEALKRLGFP